VFGVSLGGMGLFGLSGAFSPNFYVYMLFRFLVAVNSIGAYTAAFILGNLISSNEKLKKSLLLTSSMSGSHWWYLFHKYGKS
jgi:MFS family permease